MSSIPTKHGDERNRRFVTDAHPAEGVTPGGTRVALGSSWTREVMERWCEHCADWVRCDGIMGALAFGLEHPNEPHAPKPLAKHVP